jgi:hypothetical protein
MFLLTLHDGFKSEQFVYNYFVMSIIDQLASSLKRRDEVPNQELAEKIAKHNDAEAVKELIDLLQHKSKDIQHDSIKVLYEIGERKPALISGYIHVFLDLLQHKNNRLQWGGMAALESITPENPQGIFHSLAPIIEAAEKGSVITRDMAVKILVELCSLQELYSETAFPLLVEQILKSPANQVPMYAEIAIPVITPLNKASFIKALNSRLEDMEKESKRKRVEKVIRKFS